MLKLTFDIGGTGIKIVEFKDNKKIKSYKVSYSNKKEDIFSGTTDLEVVLNEVKKICE